MSTVRNIRDLLAKRSIEGTVQEDEHRIRIVTSHTVPLDIQEEIREMAFIGTVLTFLVDPKDKVPVPQPLFKWMKDTGKYINDSSKN